MYRPTGVVAVSSSKLKLIVTETYEEVEKFVHKLVNDVSSKYGLDRDDVLEVSLWGFMQAYLSYIPEKGKFSTWTGYKVKKRISDLIRVKQLEGKRFTTDMDLDIIAKKEYSQLKMEDWLSELPEDARTVASLVLKTPIDVKLSLIQLGKETPANWREAMREFLLDIGWSRNRITQAFRMVKHSL